jgi:gephyrin
VTEYVLCLHSLLYFDNFPQAHTGTYADTSGPEIAKLLKAMSESAGYPVQYEVRCTAVVPDDCTAIQDVVQRWCDGNNESRVDVLLSTGGTGFGARDFTPEAIRPLFHREAPAIADALIAEGLKHTPLALLSRPVVGVRGRTLICTLPGSVKAVRENIVVLQPLLPRILELLIDNTCHSH